MRVYIGKLKKVINKWADKLLFEKKRGKKVIRKSFVIVTIVLFGLVLISTLYLKDNKQKYLAYEKTANGSTEYAGENLAKDKPTESDDTSINGYIDGKKKSKSKKKRKKIKYNLLGRQSFSLKNNYGASSSNKKFVTGTKFVSKLSSGIDTRDKGGLIQVKTIFTIKSKNGAVIPKGSTFIGGFKYKGGSKRVYLKFNKLFLPNGNSIKISAVALSPKDFRPGIIGEHHSKIVERMTGPMVLTAISTASDVMTSKKQIGTSSSVTVDPNVNNAALQALSKATEYEASRSLMDEENQKEYLTVEINSPVIIQLVQSVDVTNGK